MGLFDDIARSSQRAYREAKRSYDEVKESHLERQEFDSLTPLFAGLGKMTYRHLTFRLNVNDEVNSDAWMVHLASINSIIHSRYGVFGENYPLRGDKTPEGLFVDLGIRAHANRSTWPEPEMRPILDAIWAWDAHPPLFPEPMGSAIRSQKPKSAWGDPVRGRVACRRHKLAEDLHIGDLIVMGEVRDGSGSWEDAMTVTEVRKEWGGYTVRGTNSYVSKTRYWPLEVVDCIELNGAPSSHAVTLLGGQSASELLRDHPSFEG